MTKKLFNIEALVRENVKNMSPYTSARDEFKDFKKQMIYLDANESPYNTGVNRYPDPKQLELKLVISSLKSISSSSILLGNGSDEVLDLIFRAFCEPGVDNVITLPPTYGMYKVLAATNNVENREVLLTDDFQPDIEGIFSVVDENTKVLFFCSPNNPTANTMEADLVEEVLRKFNGLVVIDEAYIDFSKYSSWINQLADYPNLIVVQTLSKAYGMAAIRLGMLMASEEIIDILNKIKPPYNVNELTQEKAKEGLLKFMENIEHVDEIFREKLKLVEALKGFKFVLKSYPSDTNFILVKVDDANLRYQQLIDIGIVVRNRSTQPLCESTLRITVGTPEENIKLLKAFNQLENI